MYRPALPVHWCCSCQLPSSRRRRRLCFRQRRAGEQWPGPSRSSRSYVSRFTARRGRLPPTADTTRPFGRPALPPERHQGCSEAQRYFCWTSPPRQSTPQPLTPALTIERRECALLTLLAPLSQMRGAQPLAAQQRAGLARLRAGVRFPQHAQLVLRRKRLGFGRPTNSGSGGPPTATSPATLHSGRLRLPPLQGRRLRCAPSPTSCRAPFPPSRVSNSLIMSVSHCPGRIPLEGCDAGPASRLPRAPGESSQRAGPLHDLAHRRQVAGLQWGA